MTTNQLYTLLNFYKGKSEGTLDYADVMKERIESVLERDRMRLLGEPTCDNDEYLDELYQILYVQ